MHGRRESSRRITVLLSSAGRRVMLGEAFREGARDLGIALTLVATDMAPGLSAACHSADRAYAVPPATDPDYIETTLRICEDEGVALLIPTIDTELEPLALASDRFAAIGTRLLLDQRLVAIARDKLLTAHWLKGIGVPVPLTEDLEAARTETIPGLFPAIVKPRGGSAGRGISRAASAADLPSSATEPMVVQQALRGDEWTVNVFVQCDGRIGTVVPHRRLAIRAGEVEKGATARHPALRAAAEAIVDALPGLSGVFCFQAMCDDAGGIGIFEINARFGGGYPLAHHAGASFGRWLLEEVAELPSSACDDWHPGTTMLRYDAAVFTEA